MSAPPGTIHGTTPTPPGNTTGALGGALPQGAGKVPGGQRQDIGHGDHVGRMRVVDHPAGRRPSPPCARSGSCKWLGELAGGLVRPSPGPTPCASCPRPRLISQQAKIVLGRLESRCADTCRCPWPGNIPLAGCPPERPVPTHAAGQGVHEGWPALRRFLRAAWR